ncbi:MAG TPA: D-sedoheptulose 7-phosphate isomerase [Candidatus Sulfotelmatobacter sp.]|nr:D-sedoheptulose 7-phosphate isomerase [Candidatus Sulfotelmatobacter sp.]
MNGVKDTLEVYSLIRERLQSAIALKQALLLDETFHRSVIRVASRVIQSLTSGGKVIFFGNGGSAADAQHLAAEFTGRYLKERAALPALALSVNSSSLTAIGNDYGFDLVFARQLEALGRAGDVAIGISTSGNSPNVVRGLEAAKSKSLFTVSLTGGSGGKMADVVDCAIYIPSNETPRIQECHILTGHLICEIVERELCDRLGAHEQKI